MAPAGRLRLQAEDLPVLVVAAMVAAEGVKPQAGTGAPGFPEH
jgi:hypothetical protein